MMPCIILAGGKGTRLGDLTKLTPKPLLPVLGRPFLAFVFEELARQGVTDLIVSVSYMAHQFEETLGDGSRYGVRVRWVDEGEMPLGTGGCIRYCLDHAEIEEEFFVTFGDTFLQVDYAGVEQAFRRSGCPALMTVMRNGGRWDRSNADYLDGRVVFYSKDEKALQARKPEWIDYGLMAMNRNAIMQRVPPGRPYDLAMVMHDLCRDGMLAGYPVDKRFYEIGSPGGIAAFEQWFNYKETGV